MTRLLRSRQRLEWEAARGLPPGTSAARPAPINWGKVAGWALIGGAAYALMKETGSSPPASVTEPVVPSAPDPWGGSFMFAPARQPSSFVGRAMEWTSNHTPHLAAAAAGYELIKDPTLLQRTLEAAVQPRALTPPVAQPVARTIPVIGSIVSPVETVRTSPREAPATAWRPPSDHQLLTQAPHPAVTVFVGPRGSGKTHTAHGLLDQLRVHAAPYVVGPASLRRLLPREIGVVQRLEEVPPHAAVLIDEAYLMFGARNSMTAAGRSVGQVVNLSRQRGWSLIFVTQDSRQLDVNVLSQTDVLAITGVSEIGREYERRELCPFTERARAAFATIQGDPRPWTWVFSQKTGFSGLVRHEPASYWRPALSNAFAGAMSADDEPNVVGKTTAPRHGERVSKETLRPWAKDLVLVQGLSYGQAATIMTLPKSTVWDLVNEK